MWIGCLGYIRKSLLACRSPSHLFLLPEEASGRDPDSCKPSASLGSSSGFLRLWSEQTDEHLASIHTSHISGLEGSEKHPGLPNERSCSMSHCCTGCCTSRCGCVCFQSVPFLVFTPCWDSWRHSALAPSPGVTAPRELLLGQHHSMAQSITCLGKHISGAALQKKAVLLILNVLLICSWWGFFSN